MNGVIQSMAAMNNAWISSPRSNPQASLRLFCFPFSGSAASVFYSWASVLPDSIEILPVQYPGHGTRVGDRLYTDLPELIQAAKEGLTPYLDKPFAFFGHSMGALVSFELARSLQHEGAPVPQYLFVSGHNAPHLPDTSEQIHLLPEARFVEKLRTLNGTPEDVLQNAELLELILPILRADFTVCETYRYQPSPALNFPICACGGLQDQYTDKEGLEAWRLHTTAGFSVRLFPGDHFYLIPSRMYLLQVLARELSQVATL